MSAPAAGSPVRYFEDVQVGDIVDTPGRTVTEADLVCFAAISGDHDGLDRVVERPVPDHLVVLLTSGLGFRVPAAQLSIVAFMVLDWEFCAPVRLGDTLHCRMWVAAKRGLKEGGIIVEEREIVNQRGEVVQRGEYKLMVARRPRG
ncbi:MAG: dehydratase [Candidatus Rokuibacteriota bacterium]